MEERGDANQSPELCIPLNEQMFLEDTLLTPNIYDSHLEMLLAFDINLKVLIYSLLFE